MFVAAYRPDTRHERVESEWFRRFSYEQLIARDKVNLDITRLEISGGPPAPEVLIAEV
jgi:type I restriction enzyme M protein